MSSETEIRRTLAEVSEIMRHAGIDDAGIAKVAERWAELAAAPAASLVQDNRAQTEPADTAAGSSAAKYPNVRVRLGDLGSEPGPIMRRVSYALSDAGVEDAEIERYKAEVRDRGDALGVTRRWVQVERK